MDTYDFAMNLQTARNGVMAEARPTVKRAILSELEVLPPAREPAS